jgi:ABC-type phosphate transport system substrate-binding protein
MKVSSSFVSRHRPFEVRLKMSMRQRIALVLAVVSISMIGMGLGSQKVMAEPPVRADATATGTVSRGGVVSPGTSLTNEVVTVSWSGFTPTLQNGLYGVLVVQCKGTPASLSDCYTAEPYPDLANGTRASSTTASNGTGSTRIEIRPSSFLPLLNCSASNPCSVMVYENDGQSIPVGGLPASRVVVPITFAPSQADCPIITDFDVRGDGSATSAGLFYDWAAKLCTGETAVVVDYTENSSTTGRENFLAGLTDFGVSALPATAEELAAHPDHREFTYVPLVASAAVIAYNFTDPFTGQPLDNLILSPRLVARVITNTSLETFFQDRELLRLNPGVRFPTSVLARPLIRAERNADTRIVTSWFSSDATAQRFLAGNGSDSFRIEVSREYIGYSYPQDLFETVSADSSYLPRQGQRAVSLKLFYGVTPTGSVRENTTTTGFIGIVDLPTAKRFGLKVAKIAQSDGTSVAPTDASILAGIADMESSPEGLLIADTTPDDLTAYPLVKIDYALVPKTFASQKKVDKIKRLLQFGLTDGQMALPAGYVALPEALKSAALTSIEAVSIPTTTTTTLAPAPTTTAPKKKPVPPATTMAPETTTTTTSTTSTTTTTTTTTLAPITVPQATSDLPGSGSSKSGMLYTGLIGLSGAALVGTVKPRKKVAKS